LQETPALSPRLRALYAGLGATVIWASTFIFIKIALQDLGPLSIAGMRYFGGFLILLPFMRGSVRSLGRDLWWQMAWLGISCYLVGNGAFFWSLKYLPAVTASFMVGFLSIAMLIGGAIWLKEFPRPLQIVGTLICLFGSGLFFSPGIAAGESVGYALAGIGLLGFIAFGLLGRSVARQQHVDTVILTALPLGLGGILTLVIALVVEGLPRFSLQSGLIVLWLAAVNTSLAYWLYTFALRTLTALEMNVLLNLSPLITAVLAWITIDERLSRIELVGMLVALLGIGLVQYRKDADGAMDGPIKE